MAKKVKKLSNGQVVDNSQILYQAYGVLRGRLIWSGDQLTSLMLLDETIIPVNHHKPNLLPWLTRRRVKLEAESHLWGVYPRQDDAIVLNLTLATQTLVAPPLEEDRFIIAGRIAVPPDGHRIVVEIYRNRLPRKHTGQAPEIVPSFYLTIQGNLQVAYVGQIWRLNCIRSGLDIQLQNADHIQTSDMYSPDFTEFRPSITELIV